MTQNELEACVLDNVQWDYRRFIAIKGGGTIWKMRGCFVDILSEKRGSVASVTNECVGRFRLAFIFNIAIREQS